MLCSPLVWFRIWCYVDNRLGQPVCMYIHMFICIYLHSALSNKKDIHFYKLAVPLIHCPSPIHQNFTGALLCTRHYTSYIVTNTKKTWSLFFMESHYAGDKNTCNISREIWILTVIQILWLKCFLVAHFWGRPRDLCEFQSTSCHCDLFSLLDGGGDSGLF